VGCSTTDDDILTEFVAMSVIYLCNRSHFPVCSRSSVVAIGPTTKEPNLLALELFFLNFSTPCI